MHCKRKRKRNEGEEGATGDGEDEEVYRRGGAVYFEGEVNHAKINKLRKALDDASKDALLYSNTIDSPRVALYIRSDGGCVFAGFAGFSVIRRSIVPVVTIADGYTASAATFLLLGGIDRRIVKGSHVLIHQVSSDASGTFQNVRDDAKNCAVIMKQMREFYETETHLPEKKLNKLLTRELDLSTAQCIKHGVVHATL